MCIVTFGCIRRPWWRVLWAAHALNTELADPRGANKQHTYIRWANRNRGEAEWLGFFFFLVGNDTLAPVVGLFRLFFFLRCICMYKLGCYVSYIFSMEHQ